MHSVDLFFGLALVTSMRVVLLLNSRLYTLFLTSGGRLRKPRRPLRCVLSVC